MNKQQQYQNLLHLLNQGQFVSGAELAQQLGYSRTVVHRRLQELKSYGLAIHAIVGRGYRLVETNVLLDIENLVLPPAVQHHHHMMTTSTNYDAFSLLKLQTQPVLVTTDYQSVGRGRRGQVWRSPLGANLLFSMGFWLSEQDVFRPYSLHVGVLLAQTLCAHFALPFQLKWPNDLWLNEAKCAGILVELQSCQGRTALVIGIGLNVNASPSGVDQPVTSLSEHLGCQIRREQLLMPLVDALYHWVESDFSWSWQDKWSQFDALKGRDVCLIHGAKQKSGRVLGINSLGALLVATDAGEIEVTGGEVSVRIA